MKYEFFCGREWPCFENFKKSLDECEDYWSTKRRQITLIGLISEEFRHQSLAT